MTFYPFYAIENYKKKSFWVTKQENAYSYPKTYQDGFKTEEQAREWLESVLILKRIAE